MFVEELKAQLDEAVEELAPDARDLWDEIEHRREAGEKVDPTATEWFVEPYLELLQSERDGLDRVNAIARAYYEAKIEESEGWISMGEQMMSIISRAKELDPSLGINPTTGEAVAVLKKHGINPGVSDEVLNEMQVEVPMPGITWKTLEEAVLEFRPDQRIVFGLYVWKYIEEKKNPSYRRVQKLIADVATLDEERAAEEIERLRRQRGEDDPEVWQGICRMIDFEQSTSAGRSPRECIEENIDGRRLELFVALVDVAQEDELEAGETVIELTDEGIEESLALFDTLREQGDRAKEIVEELPEEKQRLFFASLQVLEVEDSAVLAEEIRDLPDEEIGERIAELENEIHTAVEEFYREIEERYAALNEGRKRIFEALTCEERHKAGKRPPSPDATFELVENLPDEEVRALQHRLRRVRRGLEL
jgi:hypothetical protein